MPSGCPPKWFSQDGQGQDGQGVAPLEAAEFSSLMQDGHLCQDGQHLAVAVSGGADSLSLCLLAKGWADARGILLTALTVDHGLRHGSSAEAKQVASWMLTHDIPHHILTWSHDGAVFTGVQERARTARYALMTDWCRSFDVKMLLLAHHQGDQAETVLMRLKKGSTLFGLSAMAKTRLDQGIVLYRPLLNIAKERLLATLKNQGQDWIEDPSNQNQAFERVRVRQHMKILESQGVTATRLVGAASGARAVCDIIDVAANDFIKTMVLERTSDQLKLNVELLKAPDVILARVLSKLLMRQGRGVYPPSPDKIDRLVKWLKSCDFAVRDTRTLAGCLIYAGKHDIQIKPELPRKNCKKSL